MTRFDPRDEPTQSLIESIRRNHDVEHEIDRTLTRKMRTRSTPENAAVPLQQLVERVERWLCHELGGDFTLTNARWMQGGASKIQAVFDLSWRGEEGLTPQTTTLVLRMDPPAGIVETSRLREAQVLQAVAGTVPAPTCFWVDSEADYLPYPGLLCGHVNGVTKPTKTDFAQVAGIGTNFGYSQLRASLGNQLVEQLAKIHTLSPTPNQLTAFDQPELGTSTGIVQQVNWWRRVWEEDRVEDLPIIDVAATWLTANAPQLDYVSLIHGDFRSGNFLYDEEKGRITALLDWELAVLGDRHQDLAWMTSPYFGHFHEDSETFLASGVLPINELFQRYEQESGLSVDTRRIEYFYIFNTFCSTVHMLATAKRVAKHSKTHQDVVVAWLSMIGPVVLAQLRDLLEEVMS